MNIAQGDIFLADLNPVKGHEQSGIRPVIVLQKTLLNQKLNTVMIVPLTSNKKAKNFLLTHFLPKKITNLNHDSVALVFQVRTIDKSRLTKRVAQLSSQQITLIKEKLNYAIWLLHNPDHKIIQFNLRLGKSFGEHDYFFANNGLKIT